MQIAHLSTKIDKFLAHESKIVNSPSAQTAQFFNDSLRLNLEQFFPNDSLVYDVFVFVSMRISVLQGQAKVENQFARISRLRKFLISKSQNPKI